MHLHEAAARSALSYCGTPREKGLSVHTDPATPQPADHEQPPVHPKRTRRRRRTTALIATLSVLILVLGGVLWFGRDLFHEPTAQGTQNILADLDTRNVVGVFAHPDDEQLVNGLFFRGNQIPELHSYLITVTAGEAGKQNPTVARQEDLGAVRTAEALKNSFFLGIDGHEVWDVPDSGVPESDQRDLVDRIKTVLVREQADTVVTFWPASGATGHKDHMAVGLATERAIAELGDAPEAGYAGPRWLIYPTSPTKALKMFGGETGAFVVEHQPDPTTAMPGEVRKKLAGWQIHASQEHFMQGSYHLPAWLAYTFWDHEFYVVRDLDADPVSPAPLGA